MTSDDFRKLALSFPDAEERSHMGHPDFRAAGKIFATLGSAGDGWGMVSLDPGQQRVYVQLDPNAFVPAKGAWGLKGATMVRLASANADTVAEAMKAAWQGTTVKKRRASGGSRP